MTFKVTAVYAYAASLICVMASVKAASPGASAFIAFCAAVCAVQGTRYAIRGWRRV